MATLLAAPRPLLPQGSPTDVALIQAALRGLDYAGAHALCKNALEQHRADPRLWVLDGVALQSMHKDGEALQSFRAALRLAPAFRPALEGEAQMLYRRGDPAAVPVLQDLLRRFPNDAVSSGMLGDLLFREGDYAAAKILLGNAASLVSGDPRLEAEYAIALANMGSFTEAATAFAAALSIRPSDPVLRYNLALAHWRAGNLAGAQEALSPLLTRSDCPSEGHALAARLLEAQDDVPGAVEELRKAIQLDPKEVENYLEFATLCYRYRSYQAGINMIDAGLTQLPRSAPLHIARGTLEAQLGKFEIASVDFEQANELDPKGAFGTVAGGVARAQQQDSAGAIAAYRNQIRLQPNDALPHYLLAETLSEKVESEQPESAAEVLHELATAIRLDSKMTQALDLQAKLLLRSNLPGEAALAARKALANDPEDEQALYALLLASRKLGDKDAVLSIAKRLADAHEKTQAADAGRRNFEILGVPSLGKKEYK